MIEIKKELIEVKLLALDAAVKTLAACASSSKDILVPKDVLNLADDVYAWAIKEEIENVNIPLGTKIHILDK